jgi:hypothetical protein
MKPLRLFSIALTLCFALTLLAGCNGNATTPTSPTDSTAIAAKPSNELIAGEWCYDFKDKTLHQTAVMEYDGKSAVKGTLYGDIQDSVEAYFATYITTFEGVHEAGYLKVKTTTEIEGDVQEESASWAWDGKTLTEGLHKMVQVNCEPSPEE